VKELKFIGGVFFEYVLPKEKNFLFKYFRTDIEKAFLRYYYCFGEYDHFSDHTGHRCQKRWLRLLRQRHDALVEAHAAAKQEADFDLLALIESGKYKLKG
jgi:coproporphyrinogen III oxidase